MWAVPSLGETTAPSLFDAAVVTEESDRPDPALWPCDGRGHDTRE